MWEYNYPNELYHYGVKGMKWGVRKYQKNAGAYTRKGLARYQTAQDNYDRVRASVKKTKAAYKSGSATKEQYNAARSQLKGSKRELNKSYKNLKYDKKADQGRELYSKGKRIRENLKYNAVAQGWIAVGSQMARIVLHNSENRKVARLASSAIAIGGTAVNAIIAGKTLSDNSKLRAYYGHR